MAWTAGVKLCECDVAVTSDGFIVLGAIVSIAAVRTESQPSKPQYG
jgi:hypothetical protein